MVGTKARGGGGGRDKYPLFHYRVLGQSHEWPGLPHSKIGANLPSRRSVTHKSTNTRHGRASCTIIYIFFYFFLGVPPRFWGVLHEKREKAPRFECNKAVAQVGLNKMNRGAKQNKIDRNSDGFGLRSTDIQKKEQSPKSGIPL